jgi:hypothetical protein
MRNQVRAMMVMLASVGAGACSDDATPMVTAQGVVYNINKFAIRRIQGASGADAFASAVTAGQKISTTASLDVQSEPSAADGSFSVKVPANSTFFMVAYENSEFVRTQTIFPITTTDQDITLPVGVIACPEVAETTILANGAGLPVTDLIERGYSVFQTAMLPAPPENLPVPDTTVSIAESADFDVYRFEGIHPDPTIAVLGNSSPLALYGIVAKTKTADVRDVHVTVNDPNTGRIFDPLTIPIRSGYFSSALALSTR